jgi:hypothetical protein
VGTEIGWPHERPKDGQREAQHHEIAPVEPGDAEKSLHVEKAVLFVGTT